MAMTAEGQFDESLGVGGIVGESFSILFRKFPVVIMLALIPAVIGLVISGLIAGWDYALGTAMEAGDFSWVATAFVSVINIVMYGLTTALLVQFAYDAKLGRRMNIGRYLSRALACLPAVVLLSIVVSILGTLGMIALIVPGLWIYAVLSVVPPAIVIEGGGYRSMGRSRELTKGYRWPIVGAMAILIICTMIVSGVAMFLVASMPGSFMMGVASVLINAVTYGLFGIAISLIYARLREIKEGVAVDQIAAVFD